MFTRNYDCSGDSSCFEPTAKPHQKLLGLLLILFWSLLTLTADTGIGYHALKQLQSNRFPIAKGRITKSDAVRSGSGMGGPNYGVDVAYDFIVDGKAYTGRQFRYGTGGSNDGYAARIVQSLPVSKEVDVFYNPADPTDCVLSRGLDGVDLFLAMFMMPFNLFMLCLWAGLPYLLRSIFTRRESERISEPSVSNDLTPLAAALAVLAAASFLMTFVVGIPMGFHPPLLVMQVVWMILISSSVVTYFVAWQKQVKSKRSIEDVHE